MAGETVMGYLFIQRPDGSSTTYLVDGTVINEMRGIQIDWCDKCEKWKPLEHGHYLQNAGEKLMWFCAECKK